MEQTKEELQLLILTKKRVMYCFETHHSDAVYALSWGPCEKAPTKDEKTDKFYLYSCGGGKVYIHKLKEFKDKALDFEDLAEWPPEHQPTEMHWSEVIWKPDYSCICLGSFKGFIDIFNDKFVFLTRFNVQMKSVECLRWHPENTYMSPNGSPYKFWLASCGSDTDIHIFDVSNVLRITEGEKTATEDVFRKLVGHKKRVVKLCWSQHDDGFLVSASKDSSVLVWNVSTGAIIATYLDHRDVVYAVQWSVFDKDIIYSGGQDSAVRVWRISDQSISEIPDNIPNRKRMKKPKKLTSSYSSVKEKSPSEMKNGLSFEDDVDEVKISHGGESAEDTFSKGDKDSNVIVDQPQKEKKVSVKTSSEDKASKPMKSVRSSQYTIRKVSQLFPEHSYAKAGNLQDVNECERLADILCMKNSKPSSAIQHGNLAESRKVSDDDVITLGPFLDQLSAIKLLKIRGEISKSEGDHLNSMQLGIMAGNLKPTLQEAADNNNLNPYLVSLAPCVSHIFWLEMCEKYAVQLVEEHLYHAASNYYLMCGKIYDAINILSDKESPIDALVLAKTHLPESDPIIPKLLLKAAKKYTFTSNKIGEAKCFLALNEPLVAAKVLAAQTDPNFIRVAAYICRKFNLEKDADIYAFMCLEKCLLTFSWPSFQLLLNQEPKMQVYKVLATIHETFHVKSRSLKNKSGIISKDIFPPDDPTNEISIWKGSACLDAKVSFIDYAYDYLLSEKESDLKEMLEALKLLSEKQNVSTSSHAHVTIAICITEFIILCHLEEPILASQVFLKIFEAACGDKCLQKAVSFLLLPLGLDWNKDTKTFNCQTIACENEQNNVLLYKTICNSLIEKINSFEIQSIKSVTIVKEELLLDIRYAASRMCNILLTKNAADYALSFFSASILDCLLKTVNEKVQPLKCFASLCSNTLSSNTAITETVLQNDHQNKNSVENYTGETSSERETNLNEAVEALLQKVTELANADSSEVDEIPFETSTDTASSDLVQTTKSCTNVLTENISLSENSVHNKEIIEENCATEEPLVPTNSHVKCLESIEIFYNLVSFIAFNICKDEYALLYYLKRWKDDINAAKASEVLSKFSKENKMESKVSASDVTKTSLDCDKEMEDNCKDMVPKLQESEQKGNINQNLGEYVTNEIDSGFVEVQSNLSLQNSSEKLELSESKPCKHVVLNEATEVASSNQSELIEINHADHNCALEVEETEESKESIHLIGTEDNVNKLISTENNVTNENISNELSELTELITTLEKITQIRYPNPLVAIPKIIQVTYKVIENSECSVVKDKLLEFVQDLTSWSDKFSS